MNHIFTFTIVTKYCTICIVWLSFMHSNESKLIQDGLILNEIWWRYWVYVLGWTNKIVTVQKTINRDHIQLLLNPHFLLLVAFYVSNWNNAMHFRERLFVALETELVVMWYVDYSVVVADCRPATAELFWLLFLCFEIMLLRQRC